MSGYREAQPPGFEKTPDLRTWESEVPCPRCRAALYCGEKDGIEVSGCGHCGRHLGHDRGGEACPRDGLACARGAREEGRAGDPRAPLGRDPRARVQRMRCAHASLEDRRGGRRLVCAWYMVRPRGAGRRHAARPRGCSSPPGGRGRLPGRRRRPQEVRPVEGRRGLLPGPRSAEAVSERHACVRFRRARSRALGCDAWGWPRAARGRPRARTGCGGRADPVRSRPGGS